MEIGLIADTHGFLDPLVLEAFSNCDEIWHAGDFGDIRVANELAAFKPLRGVYGNIDDNEIRVAYPEDLRFELGGVDVLITHIAGQPGRYNSRVRKMLRQDPPHVLLCGHTHIPNVERDDQFAGMYCLNPGAAGHQGFHQMRTLLKCTIADNKLGNLRLIELGPRGRRPKLESTPDDI